MRHQKPWAGSKLVWPQWDPAAPGLIFPALPTSQTEASRRLQSTGNVIVGNLNTTQQMFKSNEGQERNNTSQGFPCRKGFMSTSWTIVNIADQHSFFFSCHVFHVWADLVFVTLYVAYSKSKIKWNEFVECKKLVILANVNTVRTITRTETINIYCLLKCSNWMVLLSNSLRITEQ